MNTHHEADQPGETRDDPTLDPTLDTTPADLPTSSDTQQIEQPLTQQIEIEAVPVNSQHPAEPSPAPFRVEPSMPVPDDAVADPTPGGEVGPAAGAPHPQAAPAPAGSPGLVSARPPAAYGQGLVTVRRGPLPMTIMLGLLSIIVAGYILATNLLGADFDLRVAGPTLFATFGGLLLLVGLIGVVAGGRSRNRD